MRATIVTVKDYEMIKTRCDVMIKTQTSDLFEDLDEASGVPYDVVLDVYRQRYKAHVKKTAGHHRRNCACSADSAKGVHAPRCRRYSASEWASSSSSSSSSARRSSDGGWSFEWDRLGLRDAQDQRCYVRRFLEDTDERGNAASIVDLADAVNSSPYLLARMLIEKLCGIKPGKRVGQVVKDPSLITASKCVEADRDAVAERLRDGLAEAIEFDQQNSPHLDRLKKNAGDEYEYLLQEKLRLRGVAFESEESLRDQGQFKTPDVVLLQPMGVVDRASGAACIVNWIDSKKMFGSPETHQQNQEQFNAYTHRHGSGLVVYWGGYVEGLADDNPDVIVMDDLPLRWLVAGRATASSLAVEGSDGKK